MPRPLAHGIHPGYPPHTPEDEPTHGDIFEALMDIRERLGRIEIEMGKLQRAKSTDVM